MNDADLKKLVHAAAKKQHSLFKFLAYDIDELIQQVRIRLWKYPPKCKLSSAVFNAVKCILIQELKKRKNTKIVQLSDEIDIGYTLKEEPSLDNLTKVEQEVIQMKMQGYTNKDIANKLGVVHQRVSQLIHSAGRKYRGDHRTARL